MTTIRVSIGRALAAVIVPAALLAAGGPARAMPAFAAAPASGLWGRAQALPMTGRLASSSGVSLVMSCGAAGSCTVAGTVIHTTDDVARRVAAFRASETRGSWGAATRISGFSALRGRAPDPAAISCASAGNCLIGGFYQRGGARPWLAAEVRGRWHAAAELPGIAALAGTRAARITSVSCPAVGDCVAGGHYTDSAGRQQAFVSSQVNGVWGRPRELPGTGALNAGGSALVRQISCASPGNCAAAGDYAAAAPHVLAFVASEVQGTWRPAISLPGLLALGATDAQLTSLSCGSAGNCAAVGSYNEQDPLAVSEVHGTWGNAVALQSPAGGQPQGLAETVACTRGDHCTAGGFYFTDPAGHTKAFIATATNGSWHKETPVPGIARLGSGSATVSVSCAAPGECAAGGSYRGPGPVHDQAFVASEVRGRWRDAQQVPGTGRLNKNRAGFGQTSVLSCPAAGHCELTGGYTARRLLNPFWVFTDSQQ